MMVGALVLAAGSGARAWPDDKLLARDAAGRTMLGRVLTMLAASRIEHVVVVGGHRADRLQDIVGAVRLILADDHAEGIAASLRRGIQEAVNCQWDAALVCLADMPLITPSTINRLANAVHEDGRWPDAVVPIHDGQRGNPVRWDRRLFGDLASLSGDAGARTILRRPGLDVLTQTVDDPGVLQDFDTSDRLAVYRNAR